MNFKYGNKSEKAIKIIILVSLNNIIDLLTKKNCVIIFKNLYFIL